MYYGYILVDCFSFLISYYCILECRLFYIKPSFFPKIIFFLTIPVLNNGRKLNGVSRRPVFYGKVP